MILFQFPFERNDAKWQTKEKHLAIHVFSSSAIAFKWKASFVITHTVFFFHQINYFSKHSYSLTSVKNEKTTVRNEKNEHLFPSDVYLQKIHFSVRKGKKSPIMQKKKMSLALSTKAQSTRTLFNRIPAFSATQFSWKS